MLFNPLNPHVSKRPRGGSRLGCIFKRKIHQSLQYDLVFNDIYLVGINELNLFGKAVML